jgi:hypothetical protein
MFPMTPEAMRKLRKCSIQVTITPSTLDVPDLHNTTHDAWAPTRQIYSELQYFERIEHLSLHIRAVGDSLWNPLWMLYHVAQPFKAMGPSTSVCEKTKLSKWYKSWDLAYTPRSGPKELDLPRVTLATRLSIRSMHGDFVWYHRKYNHTDANLTCSCRQDKTPEHLALCRKTLGTFSR